MQADNESNDLTTVVEAFRSAESVLSDLGAERDRLKKAADEFVSSEARVAKRTKDSLDMLEGVREQLRNQMERNADWTEQSAMTEKAISGALQKMSTVLDALRKIKPEQIAENLASLEKSHNDNAAELRELRRLVSDLERANRELTASQKKLGANVDKAIGEVKAEQRQIAASVTQAVTALEQVQIAIAARYKSHLVWQVVTIAVVLGTLIAALGT